MMNSDDSRWKLSSLFMQSVIACQVCLYNLDSCLYNVTLNLHLALFISEISDNGTPEAGSKEKAAFPGP